MRKLFSELLSIIITIILIVVMVFIGVIIYNNFVENDKKITVEKIQYAFSRSAQEEDDEFDKIDDPIIDEELETNYFYAQLDDDGKTIYTALNENKENMKTGTYRIELGNVFTNTLKQDDGQEQLGDSYQSAIEAYIYDNPDVFYLDVNKLYLNIQKTTKEDKVKYDVFIDNGTNDNYLAEGFEDEVDVEIYQEKIESEATKILSNLYGTNYQKIKQIHDYLVENIEYDQTLKKDNIYNIYGALVGKTCVCEGYSKSFKYLTNLAGIDCVIVAGTATNSSGKQESHAWNYVKLNGKWYAVDVTWDDPIIIGNGKLSDSSKYKYFLKGRSVMDTDHTSSGKFTTDGKEFEYPTLSEGNFN